MAQGTITSPSGESTTLETTMGTLITNITSWLAAADALSPKDKQGSRRALRDWLEMKIQSVAGFDQGASHVVTSPTALASRNWTAEV